MPVKTGLRCLVQAPCFGRGSQLELPTLKGHQHTPELVPGDFPAIDNNEWHATILSLIPFDSGSHHFIGNLQSVLTILDVRDRQGATHPIYEPP